MKYDHMNFWIDLFNRYTTKFDINDGVSVAEIISPMGKISLAATNSMSEFNASHCIVKIEDEAGVYISGFKFTLIDDPKYHHKYIVMKFTMETGVVWMLSGSYIEGRPNVDRREEVEDILTNILLVAA
jgi:hypothetical protein